MKTRAVGKTPELEAILIALEKCAYYDEINGGFISRFAIKKKLAGAPLGRVAGSGYLVCNLTPVGTKKIVFRIHRLVWLWHYGEWPQQYIDHIDRDWSNNKVENLRDVSKAINGRNRYKQCNNTSGYTGVTWNKALNKWCAYIKINGKRIHIGFFLIKEDAAAAREKWIYNHPEHGFTTQHGLGVIA